MKVAGQKFTVIGMARSGLAAANFLRRRGAEVTVIDRNPRERLAEAAAKLDPGIRTLFETSAPETGADCVVLSPGVDIDAPCLEEFKKTGKPILSEIELAFRFNDAPVLAITGTNGKSTTTTLTGQLLAAEGLRARVGGNIGTPFISLLEPPAPDYMVLEISSFQLEAVETFHPKIAAILNLTPDHIDRHRTFRRYAELKEKIAMNQTADDFLILNADDPETLKLARSQAVRRVLFSRMGEVEQGAWVQDGNIRVRLPGADGEVCPVSRMSQVLRWQVENVLASVAAAALAGVAPRSMVPVLESFQGLEHRLEWVRAVNGVDYVNDSKGTNVGSVLKSLGSADRPVILIFGGKDKESDFTPLLPLFRDRVRKLILIGEARGKIKKILNGKPPFEEAESMDAAVRMAAASAQAGDVVLLSPGCASFDMFKDYTDRGARFKASVMGLEC